MDRSQGFHDTFALLLWDIQDVVYYWLSKQIIEWTASVSETIDC